METSSKAIELIVALDLPRMDAALAMIKRLPPQISCYKVGLELFCASGPAVLRALHELNKQVFLDLKLHDIPRTVERAVQAVAPFNVRMLTLHAAGGRTMLQAAAATARDLGPCAPRLIAVTTLTSLDRNDLREIGVERDVPDQVLHMAELALSAGADGVVASVLETQALRAKFGADPWLITPGIRFSTDTAIDQKRIATPAAAIQAGANFLVVGRPILDAPDPARTAQAFLGEMARLGSEKK